jgi:hypothetical protein
LKTRLVSMSITELRRKQRKKPLRMLYARGRVGRVIRGGSR